MLIPTWRGKQLAVNDGGCRGDRYSGRPMAAGISEILLRRAVSRNPPVPLRASPDRVPDPIARILGLALLAATADALPDSASALTNSVYRLEVAGYCSLVDERVAAGFRLERDRIVADQSLDSAAIERSRMTAWQMAHAEWQNRGLGGFRNWCRTEGAEAAAYFRAIADAVDAGPLR